MIYTDDDTVQAIKNKSKTIIAAINKTDSLFDNVIDTLRGFLGKSITGNKKRITDKLKAVDNNITTIIEWDDYSGVKMRIYYWDSTQGNYTEQSHFDFVYYYRAKDNTIKDDLFIELQRTREQQQKRKARLQYTAQNIKKIAEKHKKLCDELNQIQHDCDSDLLNIAGIKSTFYC
jgi:hypothetical protein